jgi:hypothetical protein
LGPGVIATLAVICAGILSEETDPARSDPGGG